MQQRQAFALHGDNHAIAVEFESAPRDLHRTRCRDLLPRMIIRRPIRPYFVVGEIHLYVATQYHSPDIAMSIHENPRFISLQTDNAAIFQEEPHHRCTHDDCFVIFEVACVLCGDLPYLPPVVNLHTVEVLDVL